MKKLLGIAVIAGLCAMGCSDQPTTSSKKATTGSTVNSATGMTPRADTPTTRTDDTTTKKTEPKKDEPKKDKP
ncbi:MAG TPA: hypothetical protein VGY66_32765 [Gemmataceae bacterium]|jgi:hypothetical protein|nr:hypothetical protein [Gemmataceae bacterium]